MRISHARYDWFPYTNCEDMPKVMKGLGTAIISTSKGIMTDKAARAAHVGPE